ncbi:hypothetical protein [Spirillospora sp. NPDC047279]|uniref:hypothetical protein n=1 Tax=Spirillospora sp. NPDC047279 TaxID=3155478 RepID=UPI00340843C3
MKSRNPLTPGGRVTVIGLLTASTGLVVLKAAGVDMPPVPPALVMMVIAALLLALGGWRWTLVVAAVVALAEAAGFLATGSAADLVDPDSAGVLIGTWLRAAGTFTALVAAVVTFVSARKALRSS